MSSKKIRDRVDFFKNIKKIYRNAAKETLESLKKCAEESNYTIPSGEIEKINEAMFKKEEEFIKHCVMFPEAKFETEDIFEIGVCYETPIDETKLDVVYVVGDNEILIEFYCSNEYKIIGGYTGDKLYFKSFIKELEEAFYITEYFKTFELAELKVRIQEHILKVMKHFRNEQSLSYVEDEREGYIIEIEPHTLYVLLNRMILSLNNYKAMPFTVIEEEGFIILVKEEERNYKLEDEAWVVKSFYDDQDSSDIFEGISVSLAKHYRDATFKLIDMIMEYSKDTFMIESNNCCDYEFIKQIYKYGYVYINTGNSSLEIKIEKTKIK